MGIRKLRWIIIPAVVFALAFGSVGTAFAGSEDGQGQPGRYIVTLEEAVSEAARAHIEKLGGVIIKTLPLVNSYVVLIPGAAEVNAIEKIPGVIGFAEDGRVWAVDAELDDSWGVERIGAGTVHAYNKGTGINVAIIDTGIDYNHPDLDANYIGGYDFVNNDDDPMDDNGHGTHCAGIVAAEDDDIGVVGVAPEAALYAVKVLDSSGSGYLSDVVAGIEWSITNGMQVISMSLGTTTDYQALYDACDKAETAGIVVVASAGNEGIPPGKGDNVTYPAKYGSVIAVGATDQGDKRARWSSTGADLELVAPGVDIYSTLLGGTYGEKDGTSMSCPHVAGTAALVIAGEGLTNVEVRTRLQQTADDLGDAGFDTKYGYGLVDAAEAASAPAVGNRVPVADAGPDQSVKTGSTMQLDGTGSYDPDGDSITYSWAFITNPSSTATLSGADTAMPTFVADVDGTYEVELTVSDGELIASDRVVITAATVTEPTIVSVSSITYDTEGGRYQDMHLLITVALIDDFGNPIADASVSIDVVRDESPYGSGTGTTGTDGTVTFKAEIAPAGTYSTTVTDVTAEGLTWDGVTPEDNSFTKE